MPSSEKIRQVQALDCPLLGLSTDSDLDTEASSPRATSPWSGLHRSFHKQSPGGSQTNEWHEPYRISILLGRRQWVDAHRLGESGRKIGDGRKLIGSGPLSDRRQCVQFPRAWGKLSYPPNSPATSVGPYSKKRRCALGFLAHAQREAPTKRPRRLRARSHRQPGDRSGRRVVRAPLD